jgi:CDP-diacylglycerol--serine O-phosphatidyltransferase
LRAILPNAVTALALCSGLFGMRYGIAGEWDKAVYAIVLAAVLDGLDGRIARLLNGSTRFGAELDSLSDVTAFGVAPAIILYQFVLKGLHAPGAVAEWISWGWLLALAHAVCCALRLARFNASIDVKEQPHKSAGFLTGVPAPAGAGLLFLPIYLWQWTHEDIFRAPYVVAPWAALIAFLLISNLATFSWGSLRLRSHVRLGAVVVIALIGAALVQVPWHTLSIAALLYAGLIPFSVLSYAKVKRQRVRSASPTPAAEPAGPAA